MKRLFLYIAILIFCSLTVSAQKYEYGGTSDLRGLTTVYINPETDVKDRERIVKAIEKEHFPDLKVVDTPEKAEIFLVFGGDTETVITGATWSSSGANIVRVPLDYGSGYVFVDGKEKPRLVLTVSNSQQSRWEKRPVTKFVQAFIKAYRQANGLTTKP